MSVIAVCDWCKRPEACEFARGLCLCDTCQNSYEYALGDDDNQNYDNGDEDEPY